MKTSIRNGLKLAALVGSLAMAIGIPLAAVGDDSKLVTLVGAGTAADGTSQISREVVAECIMQLPTMAELQPVTDARSEFLKRIEGDLQRNESVRTYSAAVDLTYVVRQKQLVVVTTNSVERSEPVFRDVDGRFDRSIRFESNPENGDRYAGRQLVHDYYFSTEEAAIDDAMRRAEAWLLQKRAIMCERPAV